jgi:inositol oxygenase
MSTIVPNAAPDGLAIEDGWGQFVAGRYREGKGEAEFRNYDAAVVPTVAEFYKTNHAHQTLSFVLAKEKEYFALNKGKMSIWEAAEFLNTLVDESDPDTDLTQIEHLLQTSEAIRKDGHPRWMVLTGFIHDLGKVLCLYGEPQWAVVGDTFPVGCAWSDKIVFPEYFAANPDSKIPEYQTEFGIYEPHCGLENVHMSWGHDAYIGHVVNDYMPKVDLPPFLRQPVKTQNPTNGELSHGIVTQEVHQGVQAGRRTASGSRGFDGRGGARAGSQPERVASLAA